MRSKKLTSIELFAGGGGMAVGLHLAGLEHAALVEWDAKACETLRRNATAGRRGPWRPEAVIEDDVRHFAENVASAVDADVDVVAGGPPCQPFSLGGLHAGDDDRRNMFPAAIDVVRRTEPKAFVFENVPGLVRPSFRPYFDYIESRLREPTVLARRSETWRDHRDRLAKKPRGARSLRYKVTHAVLNAADFGVPQVRRRVFMIGIREHLGVEWSWDDLRKPYSDDALMYAQWVEPSYWEEHHLEPPPVPDSISGDRLHRLKLEGPPATRRWRTVRDLVAGLPAPGIGESPEGVLNHIGVPGARAYPGHTGSLIDWPAKTIKAGVHGVCGGEAMIRDWDGALRYMTVRESARAQSFPDWYEFVGARSTAMRHIGNAVAVEVARAVGVKLRATLRAARSETL